MGILKWLSNPELNENDLSGSLDNQTPTKEHFVEEKEIIQLESTDLKGIESVYSYINNSYSENGYYDALENQTIENRDVNVKALGLKLMSLIEQAEFYYETAIIDIDRRIDSAKRMGLVDLVKNLESEKIQIDKAIEKLLNIKPNIKKEEGPFLLIATSYKKGFHKGVTEISGSFTTRIKQ